MTIRYTAAPVPGANGELAPYVGRELDRVSEVVNNQADGHIDKVHVEPPRPRTGDIRYADGTDWNPGQGEGLYYYDGTRWVSYGSGASGSGAYGQFVDYSQQTCSVINKATPITWSTTAYASDIAIDGANPSRVVFTYPGKYYISFSCEMYSNSANTKTMWMFPRINGADVPGSTMKQTLATNGHHRIATRDGIFDAAAGDYLEAIFAVDDLDFYLEGSASTAFAPATPSVTLSITQVSG